jgi:Domain of unknown function (DUF6378)
MKRDEILKATIRAVGDRDRRYGEPEDNFRRIAILWNGWMNIRKVGELTGVDVAVMLMLMKVGRAAGNGEHVDNFVDAAGYAACAGELATNDVSGEGAGK